MRSKITTFIIALTVIFGLSLISLSEANSAPKQRVLFEEHTGTWCGPCGAYGKPAVKTINDKFGDKDVVYVSFHVGSDPFLLNDINQVRSAFGVTYVPSGAFNRMGLNTQQGVMVWFGAGDWAGIADQIFPQIFASQPQVEVTVNYQISGSTLIATINAEILQTLPAGDYRVGLYVVEDNLPYNQNGYSGQQPYVHNNVVRAMVGGPWGLDGIIPQNPVVGQTYSHTFNFPLDSKWKVADLQVAGLVSVFASNSRQILNSNWGVVGTPKIEVTQNGGNTHDVIAPASSMTTNFTIKNPSNEPRTYTFNAKTSSRTPGDWTAEVVVPAEFGKEDNQKQASEITLQPNASTTVGIKLNVGATIGVGDADLEVGIKNDASVKVVKKISALSSDVKKLHITADDANGNYSLVDNLSAISATGYFDLSSDDFMAFSSKLNIDMLVWSAGEAGKMTDLSSTAIRNLALKGTGVLIAGTLIMSTMESSNPNLNQFYGADFTKQIFLGAGDGKISLKGVDGDPITNGFTGNYTLENYLTCHVKSLNPKCTLILSHVTGDSAIAYRSDLNKGRAVVFGFTDKIITGTKFNDLFAKALKWISGSGSKIAVNKTSLNFGKVIMKESTEDAIVINNEGNEDLVISKIRVSDDFFDKIFTFPDVTFPINIAEGESKEIKVKFSPDKKAVFSTEIIIESNSIENTNLSIPVTGQGDTPPTSVSDDLALVSELNLVPNPVNSVSTISYVLNGNNSRNVEIKLIDATGRTLNSLVNSIQNIGIHTLEFNASDLPSGMYYLIMTTNGRTLTLPVSVVK